MLLPYAQLDTIEPVLIPDITAMFRKLRHLIFRSWVCKFGKVISDDRNFCMYCDRERPIGK
jgi:hypothetical protein